MSTVFDSIQRDKRLQEQWLRRVVAFIIDAIIVGIVFGILMFLLTFGVFKFDMFSWLLIGSFLSGVLILLYSALLESLRGATFGKELLKLRVTHRQGKLDIAKALIRNVSKLWWLFLLLDILIAFFTAGNDPKQRWLDRITETTVESTK